MRLYEPHPDNRTREYWIRTFSPRTHFRCNGCGESGVDRHEPVLVVKSTDLDLSTSRELRYHLGCQPAHSLDVEALIMDYFDRRTR